MGLGGLDGGGDGVAGRGMARDGGDGREQEGKMTGDGRVQEGQMAVTVLVGQEEGGRAQEFKMGTARGQIRGSKGQLEAR